MTSDDLVNRDYVRYLRAKLMEAERGLLDMSQKYGRVKARFDQNCIRRGITPGADMISYQELKALHPELDYWYSKVEHFQREMAAYGATLTGIVAAQQMLASEEVTHTVGWAHVVGGAEQRPSHSTAMPSP